LKQFIVVRLWFIVVWCGLLW